MSDVEREIADVYIIHQYKEIIGVTSAKHWIQQVCLPCLTWC